jgi:hypothetical protein
MWLPSGIWIVRGWEILSGHQWMWNLWKWWWGRWKWREWEPSAGYILFAYMHKSHRSVIFFLLLCFTYAINIFFHVTMLIKKFQEVSFALVRIIFIFMMINVLAFGIIVWIWKTQYWIRLNAHMNVSMLMKVIIIFKFWKFR